MKMTSSTAGIFLFVLTVFVVWGVTLIPSSARAIAPTGPNVVNVVAREYGYDMPDTLPAGPTLFHLTDAGDQLHHMTIVKFEQGKTLADFQALPPGPLPAWTVFMGGPNTPTPHGGQNEAIVDLMPGNYAVICVIPGPDGKPHMLSGMVQGLTVTPSSGRVGAMPVTDMTITLSNYAFSFSKPLTAGRHTIRIINNGDQPHEAVMFRLMPGGTGEDIANWVGSGMQGPPPAAPITGISAEAPDRDNILPVDLTAGRYALLCFMPDVADGRPHAAHGMVYDFDVL